MTATFEANVLSIPCQIELDDDYKIKRITTHHGKWVVEVSDEMKERLEDGYDYIIEAIKREDGVDAKEWKNQIKAMTNPKRYV